MFKLKIFIIFTIIYIPSILAMDMSDYYLKNGQLFQNNKQYRRAYLYYLNLINIDKFNKLGWQGLVDVGIKELKFKELQQRINKILDDNKNCDRKFFNKELIVVLIANEQGRKGEILLDEFIKDYNISESQKDSLLISVYLRAQKKSYVKDLIASMRKRVGDSSYFSQCLADIYMSDFEYIKSLHEMSKKFEGMSVQNINIFINKLLINENISDREKEEILSFLTEKATLIQRYKLIAANAFFISKDYQKSYQYHKQYMDLEDQVSTKKYLLKFTADLINEQEIQEALAYFRLYMSKFKDDIQNNDSQKLMIKLIDVRLNQQDKNVINWIERLKDISLSIYYLYMGKYYYRFDEIKKAVNFFNLASKENNLDADWYLFRLNFKDSSPAKLREEISHLKKKYKLLNKRYFRSNNKLNYYSELINLLDNKSDSLHKKILEMSRNVRSDFYDEQLLEIYLDYKQINNSLPLKNLYLSYLRFRTSGIWDGADSCLENCTQKGVIFNKIKFEYLSFLKDNQKMFRFVDKLITSKNVENGKMVYDFISRNINLKAHFHELLKKALVNFRETILAEDFRLLYYQIFGVN